ncbi:fungal-specific transcription factor domain-containing protein [Sporodiniella umbellata]|nr:fungal-specific transcription factor domain-containing protein [Sporodiniella umbellata]
MKYAYENRSEDASSEPDSTCSDKKRSRITRACDYCRKKKVKCHFTPGKPCNNCIANGAICEFNDSTKKRGPPKGYIDALEKRIRLVEEKLQVSDLSTATPTSQPGSFDHYQNTQFQGKQPQGALTDRVLYLGDLSTLQFFSNKIPLDEKKTFTGRHIRRFGKQIVLVEDVKGDEEEQEQQKQVIPHIDPIYHYVYSVTGADKYTSDRLIKIYFSNIHPVLPVVNKARFLEQYRDQAETYPPPDLLNAMLGAAARFAECEALGESSTRPKDGTWEVPIGWSDIFFEHSEKCITQSTSAPTISKVQSIILIHNHRGNLDSKSSACWMLGGIAIRVAQSLGLNRDCEEWDIPESEKQTRKRIWWSLYIADRFHSASLGRPLSIRDEDNDVAYPDSTASWKEVLDLPEENEDKSLPRFPSAMSKPSQCDGRVGIFQLFVELIKLSEILGRILQGMYTPKAKKAGLEQGSDLIVKQLDDELTKWRFAFPAALKDAAFEDFDERKGYLAPATASVLLCYFSLLILLHRPFIEARPNGKKKARSTYSSFSIGTSAATRGIRIASQMTLRDFLMFPYSFSLYPVLQCCLILMYNTKLSDTKISTPAKTDLAKGISLISKLRTMSNTAQRLYVLLKTVMSHKNIELSTTSNLEQTKRLSQGSDTESSTIPSRISDVGRGNHSHSPLDSDSAIHISSSASSYPGQYSFILSDVMAPPSMDNSASPGVSPTSSMAEAFSLKQFGFQKPLSEYEMQQLSEMPVINPHIYNQFQPFSRTSPIPMPVQVAPVYRNTGNESNERIFRNNPDNPFFGIPTSMDWTEWNEWSQSNAGGASWQL